MDQNTSFSHRKSEIFLGPSLPRLILRGERGPHTPSSSASTTTRSWLRHCCGHRGRYICFRCCDTDVMEVVGYNYRDHEMDYL